MQTSRKSVLIHQGVIDATGTQMVELEQPPNRIDWDWADEVSFILDVQSVQGAPTAWSLGAKFQFCMPDTTGAGYSAERWFDLQDVQIEKCIVEGVDWYGRSGTIVSKNLVTNPSLETASTGWGQNAGTGGVVTATRPTDGGFSGTTYKRLTWTTGSSDPSGYQQTDVTGLTAGTVYSGGIYVRTSKTQRFRGALQWKDSGSAFLTKTTGTSFSVPANTWTLVPVSGTAPTSTDRAALMAEVVAGTDAAAWAVNDTFDVDAAMLNPGTTLNAYFDGASTNGVWDGTAHASTSTRTVTKTPTPGIVADEGDALPTTMMRTVRNFGSRVRVVLAPTFTGGTAPTITCSLLAIAKG